ncbi:Mpp10 protein, partial [Conidiobolus coronatus NRRL 28638]
DDLEDEEEFQGFGDEDDEEIDQDDEAETLSAPKRTYEVDDEFFSLEKMEEFVQEAERNEMKEDDEEEEDEDDEDDVDLFADPDELDDSDADVDVNDIKFGDFFLPNSKKTTSRSKLSFKKGVDDQDLEENDDQMDVDEEEPELEEDEDNEEDQKSAFKVKKTSNLFDDDDDIMVDEDGEPLSNFEKKQAQMDEIIHDLEMQNLDNKTWTMKGEATSKDRPLNSLLEEDLEFDYASKPAPLITEEVTHDLEDLIKKRIIENQFNDVEKKVAPKVREFQPREQLDQEKSLKSLGEVYEDEYQSQVAGLPAKQQEKLSKAHQDIEELFNSVMNKLTSLSNFHYTPKAPQLKVQVVENVGAIQMEEALPTAISDAQTLAPEEVYEKSRGEIKSTEEMDSEEKKRLRNRKKRLAKLRSKDKPDPKDKVDPMIASLPKV